MIKSIWVMWVPWTHTAVAQAAVAREASGPTSDDLTRESRAGIVAICSAVFAVEALSKAAESLVVPPPISYGWTGKPCATCGQSTDHETGMVRKLREILKRSILDQALAATLAERWTPFVQLRGRAVHWQGHEVDLAEHPSGVLTSPEIVDYGSGPATAAVELLLDTLRAFCDVPKPEIRPWHEDLAHVLAEVA